MTVSELFDVLAKIPLDTPVTGLRGTSAVGGVGFEVRKMRRACQETIDTFSGAVNWFDPGSQAGIWNEERGGILEDVVVII